MPRLPHAIEPLLRFICGCGSPNETWAAIRDHLREQKDMRERQDDRVRQSDAGFSSMDGYRQFMAYVLDELGYTEHGSSICCAWLTAQGEELLDFLERHGADWHEWCSRVARE